LLEIYNKNKLEFDNSGFEFELLPVALQNKLIKLTSKYSWLNAGERAAKDWSYKNSCPSLNY